MILLILACMSSADPATAPDPGAVESVAPKDEQIQVEAPVVLLDEVGCVLELQAWRLGATSGLAWRVKMPRDATLDVVPSDTVVRLISLVPDDPGPWAAINGGFYERGPMGLVVSGGRVEHAIGARGGSGVVQWGPEPVAVVHRNAWQPGPVEALQSVDRLVDHGVSLVKKHHDARAAARSAVAVSAEHVWFIVLVDNRSVRADDQRAVPTVVLQRTVSFGLPLWAFADYLVQHVGAEQALNLDGAISTQMEVQADGERFSIVGEAGTINALVARPAASAGDSPPSTVGDQ